MLKPGEMTDVSIEMTSPSLTGIHQGQWRMCTAAGLYFGGKLSSKSLSFHCPFSESGHQHFFIDYLVILNIAECCKYSVDTTVSKRAQFIHCVQKKTPTFVFLHNS